MKVIKHALLAATLLCATPAFAQPEAGDWEFTLGGGGSADSDFDTGGFRLTGSLGYFATPNIEVALRQTLGFQSQGDTWLGSTRAAVDYHFLIGKFVPFIGANIGYVNYGDGEGTWAAAPEVGFKYYVREKTFIFTMAEYQWYFNRVRNIDNNFNDGNFEFTVGIGFNLP